MAKTLDLSDMPWESTARSARHSTTPDRLTVIRATMAELLPDESVFVVDGSPAPTDEAVLKLRRNIRQRVPGKQFVLLDDLKRRGVWIYRVVGDRPPAGRAVGPEKAEEVLRRPLD